MGLNVHLKTISVEESHLIKFYSRVKSNEDHPSAWNLSKRTIKTKILVENLKIIIESWPNTCTEKV